MFMQIKEVHPSLKYTPLHLIISINFLKCITSNFPQFVLYT